MTIETPVRILPAVQHLRGIAAAMVVISHCSLYLANVDPHLATLESREVIGTLGVAIFFIISGFIMYYTCRDDWQGQASSARSFVARRLHRIVPLYWLVTLIQFAIALATEDASDPDRPTFKALALSLFFIPYDYDGFKFRPVLGVGWTLDFEMLFYLFFALALLLPRRLGLAALAGMIAATIALGQLFVLPGEALAAFAQPIVALFALGVALGWLRDRTDWRLSPALAQWVLLAGGLAALVVMPSLPEDRSAMDFLPLLWTVALGAAGIAVFSRPTETGGWLRRSGTMLGDASYLLYLSHPIVLQIIREGAERAGVAGPTGGIAIAVTMVLASIGVAVAGHLWVEKPLLRLTKPLFRRNGAATAPA